MDKEELGARSDVIVVGDVEEIVRRDGMHREAVIRVERVLKGEIPRGGRIRVLFSPGVEDSAVFEKTHEHVLLYLREVAGGLFQTVGGFQGKLSP